MPRFRFRPLHIILAGMFLAAGIGWLVFHGRFGESLARLSYDIMFLFRDDAAKVAPEIMIVDMDETSRRELKIPETGPWSRSIHTRLLRRLTQDGARAVFFDVTFLEPSLEPGVDEDFAAAIKENGRVFLASRLETVTSADSSFQGISVKHPIPILANSAQGYGTAGVECEKDAAVRCIHYGTSQVPAATWQLARFLDASLPDDEAARCQIRWLNYCGPAGTMPRVSFAQALQPGAVSPDAFREKIVLIGARPPLSGLEAGEDEFADPWTRLGGLFTPDTEMMPGVEVHANALVNLIHGTWLTRGERQTEGSFIVVVGIIIGGLLARLRPLSAGVVGVCFAIATPMGAAWWLNHQHVWYNWLIPVVVQAPVAIAWAWGANFAFEAGERVQLREGTQRYVPKDIMKLVEVGKSLPPEGRLVEATMIFTDLQGCTTLAEKIGNSEVFAGVLNEYFSNVSEHIDANRGMVIRYQGDGVFAAWGAIEANRDHAMHAATAVWAMRCSAQIPVQGHSLVTRIGINTGTVSAVNLGSKSRVDFTLIGDAVNLAARLEGLNKHLGTVVVLSGATLEKIGDQFATRCVGRFLVVGKKDATTVHELLGPASDFANLPWMDTFARALAAFQDRDLDTAETLFQQVHAERDLIDGPSKFYLKQIGRLRKEGFSDDWTGAVEMDAK